MFLGYAVTEAASAEEALSLLDWEVDGFDVLLCDVLMPGLNGDALVSEMGRRWPAIPVVLMSGYPAQSGAGIPSEQPAGRAPVRYLDKPFSYQKLVETLREVLDQSDDRS